MYGTVLLLYMLYRLFHPQYNTCVCESYKYIFIYTCEWEKINKARNTNKLNKHEFHVEQKMDGGVCSKRLVVVISLMYCYIMWISKALI